MFKNTERQSQALAKLGGPARHVMLYGGARSGKTFIICVCIASRALIAEESRHALVRFRFNHAKASIWYDTWPKMMRLVYPDIPYEANKSDYFWSFRNRSQIWLGGLDDKERAEKILGQEYATGLLSECSQIPLASRELFRTRIAQKTILTPKLFYDENPPLITHWSHRIFLEKREPESPYAPLSDPDNYDSLLMNPGDNRENLPPELLKELEQLSPRQRARFFLGKFGDATEGALWSLETLEKYRVKSAPTDLLRVVVAVDPSGTKGDPEKSSDSIGIIVAGLGLDGHAYILEDVTVSAPPAVWGRVAVTTYDRHLADRIVGEINFGGAMVEHTVQTAAKEQGMLKVKYVEVHASRGKVVRAEPISALYDQGKVHHVGTFPDLEDQMLSFTTHGYMGEKSPDRADALVWALTELFPGVVKQQKSPDSVVIQSISGGSGAFNPHTGQYQ